MLNTARSRGEKKAKIPTNPVYDFFIRSPQTSPARGARLHKNRLKSR
jgi:hypothetical protein